MRALRSKLDHTGIAAPPDNNSVRENLLNLDLPALIFYDSVLFPTNICQGEIHNDVRHRRQIQHFPAVLHIQSLNRSTAEHVHHKLKASRKLPGAKRVFCILQSCTQSAHTAKATTQHMQSVLVMSRKCLTLCTGIAQCICKCIF